MIDSRQITIDDIHQRRRVDPGYKGLARDISIHDDEQQVANQT